MDALLRQLQRQRLAADRIRVRVHRGEVLYGHSERCTATTLAERAAIVTTAPLSALAAAATTVHV